MEEIYLKTLTGKTVTIQVKGTDTIESVKKQLETKEGIAADQQRLIFSGKELENEHLVSDYNFRKETSIIHVVLKLTGGK